MKINTKMLVFALLCFTACNNNAKEAAISKSVDTSMARKPAAEDLYKNVVFDDKYDLICGMPVTAGFRIRHITGTKYMDFAAQNAKLNL